MVYHGIRCAENCTNRDGVEFTGLFHKAIMESASALNLWSVTPPGLAKRRASLVSTVTGCPENPNEMVECLRRVPATVLVDVYNDLFVNDLCALYAL